MELKVNVELLAFGKEGEIREVHVKGLPEQTTLDHVLDEIYLHGQNELCKQPHPSLSCGDVIILGDASRYLICGRGFKKLTAEEYLHHKSLPRVDRSFNALSMS